MAATTMTSTCAALGELIFPASYWTPGRGQQLASTFQYPILGMCALYLPLIYILKKVMASRAKPLPLKNVLFVWNAILGVLSVVGAALMVCSDGRRIFTSPFIPEAQLTPTVRGVVAMFTLTKTIEFGDTIFLVLRKRPTSFLHLYHHLTVAVYCWHAQAVGVSFAHIFAIFNLSVHAIMYSYYASAIVSPQSTLLKSLRVYITLSQLAQMVVGTLISGAAYYSSGAIPTWSHEVNALTALLMYYSYLLLFAHFYFKNFMTGTRPGMTVFLLGAHVLALVGFGVWVMHPRKWRLFWEMLFLWNLSGVGITAGAHRLWSHRAYKAKTPFRILLMVMNSIANQGSIFHWARDHRTHHKHSETDKDPHNALRGFWYSHIGWLILKKPETVKAAGKKICHQDLLDDPVVSFQRALDPWWAFFWCYIMPAMYAKWVYGEFWTGFFTLGLLRWIVELHATWCVNSWAHLWGERPYDRRINPAESAFVSWITTGEGWHNWHHVYPFDYAASELGMKSQWNLAKVFIDCGAACGQAYDLKRATAMWQKKRERLLEQGADAGEGEASADAKLLVNGVEVDGEDEKAQLKQLEQGVQELLRGEGKGEKTTEEDKESTDDSSNGDKASSTPASSPRTTTMPSKTVQGVAATLKKVPSREDLQSSIPSHCEETSLLLSIVSVTRDMSGIALVAASTFALHFIVVSLLGLIPSDLASPLRLSVEIVLWIIYAVVQGTLALGLWVVGHECASDNLSGYTAFDQTLGWLLHSFFFIPYKNHAVAVLEEPACGLTSTASLQTALEWDAFGFIYLPKGLISAFGIALASFTVIKVADTAGWGAVTKWWLGPVLVVHLWLVAYRMMLTKGASTKKDDGDSQVDVWEWLTATIERTKSRSFAVFEHMHHNVRAAHLLSMLDIRVPHYHAKEASRALYRAVQKMQQSGANSKTTKPQLWEDTRKNARRAQLIVDDTPVYNMRPRQH